MRKSKNIDLRSKLRSKGYSVEGWSRANGYSVWTVRAALSGVRNGKRSKAIREAVKSL